MFHPIRHSLMATLVLLVFANSTTAQNEFEATATSQQQPSLSQLPGIARPGMAATLRFPVGGTIERVHVKEGQKVTKGDPLVSLDDRLVRAQWKVAQVEASRTGGLSSAKTELELAERRLVRVQRAYEKEGASEFELEEERARADHARSRYESQRELKRLAEANLAVLSEQLRRQTIYAPFDGVVTQIYAKRGASVDPGSNVVAIANVDQLEVELHAPSRLYGTIAAGEEILLVAGRPVERQILARAVFASPIVNSASDTFRCVLRIDNVDRKLPGGFSVVLSLPAQQEQLSQR